VPVGQGDGDHRGQVDDDDLDEAAERQAARPAPMPSVVPTDKTSSADIGRLPSGCPSLSGTKARQAAMTTRLEMAGPRVGPANRR
jgi:hypothetical protein